MSKSDRASLLPKNKIHFFFSSRHLQHLQFYFRIAAVLAQADSMLENSSIQKYKTIKTGYSGNCIQRLDGQMLCWGGGAVRSPPGTSLGTGGFKGIGGPFVRPKFIFSEQKWDAFHMGGDGMSFVKDKKCYFFFLNPNMENFNTYIRVGESHEISDCYYLSWMGSYLTTGGTSYAVYPLQNYPLENSGIKFVESSYYANAGYGIDVEQRLYLISDETQNVGPVPLPPHPVRQVLPDKKFLNLTHGDTSAICAIDTQNTAYCMLDGYAGELGDGSRPGWTDREYSFEPVRVNTDEKFSSIEVNWGHKCGLSLKGEVWCWGLGHINRESPRFCQLESFLGDCGSLLPRKLNTNGIRFREISLGYAHICGISENEKIYCWGDGTGYALGNGNEVSSRTPVEVVIPD